MIDLNTDMLSETIDTIKQKVPGTKLHSYKLDLSTDFEKFDDTMKTINKDFGQIDVLVNNAGVLAVGNLGMIDLDMGFLFLRNTVSTILDIFLKKAKPKILMII